MFFFFHLFFLSYNSPRPGMEIDSRPEAETLPDCVRTPPSKGTIDRPTTALRVAFKPRKLLGLLSSQPVLCCFVAIADAHARPSTFCLLCLAS